MAKDLVTIDLSALSQIEQDGDKFIVSAEAEDALIRLIELKQQIAEVEDAIKQSLSDSMRSLNCVKIEGESVKVTRRFYGDRFELFDPELAVSQGMAEKEIKYKPDAKMIANFQKETGELPDGVKLRERTESVTITEVKEKEE